MINATYCTLVLGLCSHGLAISRALNRHNIEVHAFEANTQLPGYKTRSAEVHLVKSINDHGLIGELLEFRTKIPTEKQIIIFPTNDNNVKVIAENIEEIRDLFIVSWASSAATVRNLLLKSNIEERCLETGLLYPKSKMADDIDSLPESLSTLTSPFIIKPVKPQSGFKALKFSTVQSAVKGLKPYAQDFPVVAQEWIEGTAEDLFFCAVHMDKGKPLHSLVGRKLESYPPALGQTTVAVTHVDENLILLTHQFFAGLDLSGPVSVEFKRDPQGNYWVIEPTVGRSDFWLGLCIAAGLDLPVLEYEISSDNRRSSPSAVHPSNAIWFDSEKDPSAPLRHISKWFGLSSKTYKPFFSYLNPRDLPPFYRASFQTMVRLSSALFKRILP